MRFRSNLAYRYFISYYSPFNPALYEKLKALSLTPAISLKRGYFGPFLVTCFSTFEQPKVASYFAPAWYKDPLLRRKNDCFGDAFGVLGQPLRPSAAAAAIIEEQICVLFSIAALLLRLFYCGHKITFTFLYSKFLQISD